MQPWQLYDYHPEPGVRPVEEWYQGQSDEVQAEFDVALSSFSAADDWTGAVEVVALEGEFLGLYTIRIDVPLPNGDELQFAAVGTWRPDSRDFILFIVCEVEGKSYDPGLEIALGYKRAWEQQGGEEHGHTFY